MLESLKHEDLQFQELSPEEKQARGILARLSGPIASFTKGTRNGRKYSDKLWEKAFDAPLVKEMFKNGGLPGELQHPEDRSETDPTKIAIMMPEPPKKDSNGHLVASVDILDTPCGQIAYQLGKYGFKFGISSRGEGDLIQDFSGEESVDPDTYTLNAFDLVLIPACEDARLQFNESLNTKKSNKLKTILKEALENASATDRRIMEEALDELNIDDNWRYVETYQDEDIYYDPDTKKYIVGDLDNQTILNSLKNAKEYIDRFNPEVLTEEQVGREETKETEKPSDLLKNKPEIKKEEPAPTPVEKDEEEKPEEEKPVDDEEDLVENIEDEEPERESWDTDFHRLDVAYNHNFKQFEDRDKNSGVIQDFIDDLDATGKDYDIYYHQTDPGCTIFFKESLNESCDGWIAFYNGKKLEITKDEADSIYNAKQKAIKELKVPKSKMGLFTIKPAYNESLNEAIEWDDLNGTEQSAVETALVEISNGSTVEDAVRGAVTMYNEENANPDYEDEDFYMEEANLQRVMDYVQSHDKTVPWTEPSDEQIAFDNDNYEKKYGEPLTEGAVTPKKKIPLTAKEFKYTMSYNGESSDINSAVVIIPNGIKLNDDSFMDAVVHCEDTAGKEINFNSVSEAQDWIDTYGDDCLYRIDNNNELHATPSQAYDIDNSEELTEEKYTRDELFDKFGTDNLDIINSGNEEEVELADDNDMAMVEQLQNILKLNKTLEEKVKSLQEKLSVGYAKEMELKEDLDTYKQKVTKLSKKTKEVQVLTEKLAKAEKMLKDNKAQAEGRISTLNESIQSKGSENDDLKKDISNLNEAIDKKNSKIRSLNEQIREYKDQLSSKEDDIKQLKEQYETGQKDLEQVRENYSKKLEQQNQIIEKYRRVAKNSVKRYVESQAIRLGVKSDEIVNRLPKNYSFNDIDRICEDLQEYKFNMSNLPFNSQMLNENIKINAKNINNGLVEANPEDEITEYDLKIAEAFL